MIGTVSDYIEYVNGLVSREEMAAQIDFEPNVNLLLLTDKNYARRIWKQLSAIISGETFDRTNVVALPGEWMTPDAIDAYGKNISEQINKACGELLADSRSRRAIIVQSSAECLTSLQWLIRDGYMNTVATFRSLDAAHLPADLYWIQTLSGRVAKRVGAKIGRTTVQAGSFHLYDKDEAKFRKAS